MTDQCRALFEVGLSEVLAEKLSDGSYSTFWVQAEWTVWQGAWQAARRAEPEKVEPVASTLEQEAISHMLEIRRIQRLIDEDRDALTDEELTQGASWITWHVDALNSVIDRITAPQQEQK